MNYTAPIKALQLNNPVVAQSQPSASVIDTSVLLKHILLRMHSTYMY